MDRLQTILSGYLQVGSGESNFLQFTLLFYCFQWEWITLVLKKEKKHMYFFLWAYLLSKRLSILRIHHKILINIAHLYLPP